MSITSSLAPWRWPHFTPDELRCKCGCGRCDMAPAFLDRLEALRTAFGRPLTISSGYRCAAHNSNPLVSKTGAAGPHTTGRAVDILIGRAAAFDLVLRHLAPLGFTGVGVKQNGDVRYVHVDDLAEGRPAFWSY